MKRSALLYLAQQTIARTDGDARLTALDAAALTLPPELAKLAKSAADATRIAYQDTEQLLAIIDQHLTGQTLLKLSEK